MLASNLMRSSRRRNFGTNSIQFIEPGALRAQSLLQTLFLDTNPPLASLPDGLFDYSTSLGHLFVVSGLMTPFVGDVLLMVCVQGDSRLPHANAPAVWHFPQRDNADRCHVCPHCSRVMNAG